MGVSFVFISSTRYIFKNDGQVPLWIKYFLYLIYQAILVTCVSYILVRINAFLLNNISAYIAPNYIAILSKIIITPITMVLNFIVLKNLVEKIK